MLNLLKAMTRAAYELLLHMQQKVAGAPTEKSVHGMMRASCASSTSSGPSVQTT